VVRAIDGSASRSRIVSIGKRNALGRSEPGIELESEGIEGHGEARIRADDEYDLDQLLLVELSSQADPCLIRDSMRVDELVGRCEQIGLEGTPGGLIRSMRDRHHPPRRDSDAACDACVLCPFIG
jgi:hypothetical protein